MRDIPQRGNMAIEEGLPPAYDSCRQCRKSSDVGIPDVTDIFQGVGCIKIDTRNNASYNYIIIAVVMHV
jgi:hypothetical protein